MKRLKNKDDVTAMRETLLKEQKWVCPICGRLIIEGEDDVLDHHHQSGRIRATVHRGCNCLLGRIENNCRRHCVPFAELPNWLRGAADYLERPHLEVYHPSFKTEGEKRLLRNKRAAKKRKAKK